jgi:Dockerin type I domain
VQIVDSSNGALLTELKQPQANLSGTLKWVGNRSTWLVSSPALSLSTLVPSSAVGVHALDLTSTVEQSVQFQLATIQAINSTKSLRIELGSNDVLQADSNWKYASVAIEGDRFVPRFTQADASLDIRSLFAWQNPLNRFDVNGDATISPVDALQVINELNNRVLTIGGAFKPPGSIPSSAFRFLDTNGSGSISPLDALLVINRLNQRGSGEGESAVTLLSDTTSLNAQSHAAHDAAMAQLTYEDEQRKRRLGKT